VDKTVRETGFDPRTGRIVDPGKFQEWKTAARPVVAQPGLTNASIFEVFRKARTAIENWVDEDGNQPLIQQGDLAAIKGHPAVEAILGRYAGYGKEMVQKLTRHLEFMVDNRRRYYLARQKAR
jgi:hypothetical protein